MRASDGKYYPGLDHMRALAAFLVFGWHFSHADDGTPAAFGTSLTPVLAPFNEGHCGVALFMCLSGYLFAKILDGKQVTWRSFYWNRFLRLGPLLILLCALRGWGVFLQQPEDLARYGKSLAAGFIEPSWPCGGWSVAVEMQFYFLLWIIVPVMRRWLPFLFVVAATGLLARSLIYASGGDVAFYAYFTIAGRIDQFVLGIAAWQFRGLLTGRHICFGAAAVAFFAFYQWFVSAGGYYATQGTNPIWIVLPTIEAAFFSFLVAYYDTTFKFSRAWYWRFAELAGASSYSIYLLHGIFIIDLSNMASKLAPSLATWEVAEACALLAFVMFVPFAWLSYRFLEAPFLRFRVPYATNISLAGSAISQALSKPLGVSAHAARRASG
jgi:peptidoglycan/LPS O-acetylase OafA/YrhL